MLGMSMTALGMNTVLAKLRGMAMKSLCLAAVLFLAGDGWIRLTLLFVS